jgi:hypothetical protein
MIKLKKIKKLGKIARKKVAPKKKVARKKAAPKKKVARSKRTYKLVSKKAAPSKLKSLHKDSKSHNVNIKVMSGIGAAQKSAAEDYKRVKERLDRTEKIIFSIDAQLHHPMYTPKEKQTLRKAYNDYKKLHREYKTHLTQLKKSM